MAGFNVLAGNIGLYTVVVHVVTPVGNNSAGVAWSTAVVNAGLNKTIMATGTGPGQISATDAASIATGTLLEGSFQWRDDPTWTGAQRIANATMLASRYSQDLLNLYADQLKYYGFIQ